MLSHVRRGSSTIVDSVQELEKIVQGRDVRSNLMLAYEETVKWICQEECNMSKRFVYRKVTKLWIIMKMWLITVIQFHAYTKITRQMTMS